MILVKKLIKNLIRKLIRKRNKGDIKMKFCWHCYHVNDNSIIEFQKKAFCKKQGYKIDHYEYTETCCKCDKTKVRVGNSNWVYPILLKSDREIDIIYLD